MNLRSLLPVCLIGSLLTLAGCNLPNVEPARADEARYFVLEGTVPLPAAPANLEVRPVRLAAYLDSRLLVTRVSAREVRYADDARWAEALDAGLTRRLRTRLQAPPAAAATAKDYAVRVTVQECEGQLNPRGGSTRFAASFEIIALADNRVLARQDFTAPARTWNGKDFDQLTAGLGEAVDDLAAAIVAALPKKP